MKLRKLLIIPLFFCLLELSITQSRASNIFVRNLTVGSSGSDVSALQQILITKGLLTIVSSPTEYFGRGTQAALQKFQAANDINPASGFFGPLTRAFLNILSTATSSLTENPIPATTTMILPSSTINPTGVQSVTIPPQAIVGLLCYYTTTSTYLNDVEQTNGEPLIFQSSGVIINSNGYILTAKHVIDPKWTLQSYASSSPNAQLFYNFINFDHCDVSIPTLSSLFTTSMIQQLNPASFLPWPRYKASVYFDPPQGSMTKQQFNDADFAILKITGVADDCSKGYFNCNNLPDIFPYVPAFLTSLPPVGSQIVTYGYPIEDNINYGNGPLYLKGAVGNVTSYDTSTYLNGVPLTMQWLAGDIFGGRSGSGIFWNGNLIGELYGKGNDIPGSQSITMQSIQQILKINGLGNLLQTN